MKINQARSLIRLSLRMMDGGLIPDRIGYAPALAELVDEETAQRIYQEELSRLGLKTTTTLNPPLNPEILAELRREIMAQGYIWMFEMVGWQGLEPWTNALKGHCSTD